MAKQDLASAAAAPVVAVRFPARGAIDVIDRLSGAVQRSLPATDDTRALALSPDGKRLFEGRGLEVLVHDLEANGDEPARRLPAGGDVLALLALADRVLAFTAKGELVAWTLGGEELERRALEVMAPVFDVDFAADGSKLLVIDEARASVFAASKEWKRTNALPQGGYRCGALSGNGGRALLGDGAERKLWTLRASATVHTFRGGEHPVASCASSRDGRSGIFIIDVAAAGTSGDRKLFLEGYDLEDKRESLALSPPATSPRALESHRLDAVVATPGGGWLLRDGPASIAVWTSPAGAWAVPQVAPDAAAPASVTHPPPDAWRTLEPAAEGLGVLGGEDAPGLARGWPRCGACDEPLTIVAHLPADDARLGLVRHAGVVVLVCLSGAGCRPSDPECHLVALTRAGGRTKSMPKGKRPQTLFAPRAASLADDPAFVAGRWPLPDPPLQRCPACDEPMRVAFALRGEAMDPDLAAAIGAATAVFVCPHEHAGALAVLGG